jgi:spermidine/putrescine transport system substrate-binding protein
MTRWLLAAVLALGVVAAGCGTDEESAKSKDEQAPLAKKGPAKGELEISQWPLYIDPGKKGTIAEFEKKTGVDVKYIEDINDNDQFYGKIRQQLEQGDSGGRSIIVLSDWLAARMDKLGYLQHFDYSALPNVKKNMLPALRHPAADPKRAFTIPWQSGMTGLIVRDDLAPGVDSINDLYDPKYKGKVSLLTEMRDSVPMTLKGMGMDPAHATEDQWLKAVDKIKEAADSGQVRKFTGNEYIKDLPKGDTWIALGWSGDAIQLQKDNPHIKFVMPKEGCMLWSTSMEIPVGAPNPQAAQDFINFVYDPQVQADIAEWVNYVTPVRGVKAILGKRDPALAKSELIFPSADYTANCSFEPVLGGKLGEDVAEAFQQAMGS